MIVHKDTEDVLGKLMIAVKGVRDKTDEDLTMYEKFDMYFGNELYSVEVHSKCKEEDLPR